MTRIKKTTIQIDEDHLKQLIKSYCFKRLKTRHFPENLTDDTDMFQAGILDSIDALELLIGFEEDCGVVIPEDLEDVSRLASFNGMCRFLLSNMDHEWLQEKLLQGTMFS